MNWGCPQSAIGKSKENSKGIFWPIADGPTVSSRFFDAISSNDLTLYGERHRKP